METNDANTALFDAAVALYQTESTLSQHYETLRSAVTGSNVALVVGIAAYGGNTGESIIFALVILSVTTGLLVIKLSQAYYFHFKLAAKMRGIIAKRHPKTFEKLNCVRVQWSRRTWYLGWLGLAPIWVALNFLIPLGLIASIQINACT